MTTITEWLDAFTQAWRSGKADRVAPLFASDALWRDYLAIELNLQTIEGRADIEAFASRFATDTNFAYTVSEQPDATDEGAFRFDTQLGHGRGYLRLSDGVCTTLFTSLLDLDKVTTGSGKSDSEAACQQDPYVLVVGGGQGGLALGAWLSELGVPYLIIDKYPNVGDQWRSRYDSLVLHDPVWFDHLPFIPYPDAWPVFTPKDQMGDWLESYAEKLSLNIQTKTELLGAHYQPDSKSWKARIATQGVESEIQVSQLVMALGLSGFPHTPSFNGRDVFAGPQVHSSVFQPTPELEGKNVVVVGANNSAHDISSTLVEVGAKPVMLQRSSTLVVKQSVYCDKMLGKLYSKAAIAQGIDADEGDFIFSSVPMRLMETRHRVLWQEIQAEDAEFYKRLTEAGFAIDFAEDGTGLGLKYRRTASGYYIDVGASEMVVDGRIRVRSGVNIERLTEGHVVLDSGETLPADVLVYATGYGNMIDWVAKLIDQDTAERVGPCWGYGSNTKGDPAPWVGELRNMWKPTAQPGLWFMGGNLAQARYFSKVLAMQLKAALHGYNAA